MILRAAAVTGFLVALTAAAGPLTPAQQRGKRLYLTGEGAAGRKVVAMIGAEADQVEVAATVVPCASCHGRAGRGKAEGGVRPPSIRHDVLFHAAVVGDRRRPAYTKPLLKRAIAMGIDSAGKQLQNPMPRYRLSIDEMSDLLAYLDVIDADLDPGLGDDTIRLGAVLPPDPAEGRDVRAALSAYFERINRGGGIFGRRVDPRFTTTPAAPPARRAAALQTFIDGEQPFAIAAAWLSGADEAMSDVAERAGVPAIAAFATRVPPDEHFVFQLLAGEREQSLALVSAAGGAGATAKRIAIVADDASVAAPVRADLVAAGCKDVSVVQSFSEADIVVFLGAPSHLAALLDSAAAAAHPPLVLIPAAHSSGDLTAAPPALDGRIFVALPSSPGDVTEEGRAELAALGVAGEHATASRIALACAKLLVEALRRGGRDVDRDTVAATLESFYEQPTALTPPVTWAPNKHVGTRAVRIATVDLQAKRWIDRGVWVAGR